MKLQPAKCPMFCGSTCTWFNSSTRGAVKSHGCPTADRPRASPPLSFAQVIKCISARCDPATWALEGNALIHVAAYAGHTDTLHTVSKKRERANICTLLILRTVQQLSIIVDSKIYLLLSYLLSWLSTTLGFVRRHTLVRRKIFSYHVDAARGAAACSLQPGDRGPSTSPPCLS